LQKVRQITLNIRYYMLKFLGLMFKKLVSRFSIPPGWQTTEELELDRIWKQVAEFDKRVV
jgi:hypothetical protein